MIPTSVQRICFLPTIRDAICRWPGRFTPRQVFTLLSQIWFFTHDKGKLRRSIRAILYHFLSAGFERYIPTNMNTETVWVRDQLLNASDAVSSGATDATSFLALGKVFSGFMTGNIVFLWTPRFAGADAPGNCGHPRTAMVAFAAGAYLSTLNRQAFRRLWHLAPTGDGRARSLTDPKFNFPAGLVQRVAGRPSIDGVAHVLLGSGLAMGMQSGAVPEHFPCAAAFLRDRCDRDRHMAYG